MTARFVIVFILLIPAGWLESAELKVLAAKSFREPLQEISEYYEGKHPETKVVLKFSKSSNVVRTLAGGGAADVILVAEGEFADRLKQKGLIDEKSFFRFLSTEFAIITTAALQSGFTGPKDLTTEKFTKIAVYKQTNPLGRKVTEYLGKLGLKETLAPKMLEVENAKAAFEAVASGQAQCLFAFPFEAAGRPAMRVAWRIPANEMPSIVYWVGISAKTTQKDLALTFVDALLSTISRKIFENSGYTVLLPAKTTS